LLVAKTQVYCIFWGMLIDTDSWLVIFSTFVPLMLTLCILARSLVLLIVALFHHTSSGYIF